MPPRIELKRYKTILTGDNFTLAPDSNEIEVSIFGPGYGECVLVHVGFNNWFIIDSCIDPIYKDPIPLAYLDAINVDPGTSVKQVIATHWHDDHIRGIGETFKICESGEFVCSIALSSKEFLTLVNAYNERSMIDGTGINEMQKVIEKLSWRKDNSVPNFTPKFAKANLPLWRNTLGHATSSYTCSIYALSPSDTAVLASQLDISKLLPLEKQPKRALISTSPNRASVVIWVNIGEYNILLGSDLEEAGDGSSGWSGILKSSLRPSGKASYFKVPHHGSSTAHNDRVWTEMLHENPVATLTPYVNGSTKLPNNIDINRISSKTNQAFVTTRPERTSSTRKRGAPVDKMIKETVKNIKEIYTSIGHIRLRFKPGKKEQIELFGNAYKI